MTSHPHASEGGHPHGAPSPEGARPASPHGKQFVKFNFFSVRDSFRAAPAAERIAAGKMLVDLLDRSSQRMLTRTYTTVGTRRDTDFMVWQVADDLHEIMDWTSAFLASPLAPVIERPYSYLSMTMRSIYDNPMHPIGPGDPGRERLRSDDSGSEYLFVYPMVKTRPWYELPHDQRQQIMNEHIDIGHAYHNIRINTTYSYGLDDQEFVVAFEGDSPGEFLALVRDLRESVSSSYTERDTPMFTCRRMPAAELAAYCGLVPSEG
jgi:chlorite dismutase